MNPLPRFVAMALFVVLAALVAMLAVPVWRGMPAAALSGTAAGPAGAAAGQPATATSTPAHALVLSQRAALTLGVVALALAVGLMLIPALRPRRRLSESRQPFTAAQTEIAALAMLAETSVAQGEELTRERDVRRRAEEDARLRQQLLNQSLDEKIRLGRDLHDGIIQSLYAAGLLLESVRALVKTDPDEAERRLEKTRDGLNDAIRDVRAYIGGLTPEKLRRAGFAHALAGLLSDIRAGRESRFDITIDDDAAALLTPEQTIEALQIAREAVSNALRHGRATMITVRMHQSDREVCLLVQDNGTGFDAERPADGGHGLVNMHARAERLGASLRVTSQPGEGTRVLATLPILQPTAT
jgi:signal transduction histidine kinase